ncbi:MAG TPA: hypothetical protein VGS21_07515, partial [Acidimicrobiales bacterium]|nr:hypothetical protein [Acidimicrobiales bacterium]
EHGLGVTQGFDDVWNGSAWQTGSIPLPAGSFLATLTGLSCSSPSFCMAVGNYATGDFSVVWNGTSWKLAPLIGGQNDRWWAVSCSASTWCLAVGSSYVSTAFVPIADKWTGSAWANAKAPLPPGGAAGELDGVSCVSSLFCMAVGSYHTANAAEDAAWASELSSGVWTATATTPSSSPSSTLGSVSCVSASSCVAAGDGSPALAVGPAVGEVPTVDAWNGSAWTGSTVSPMASGAWLYGVSCSGASCVSVGSQATANADLGFSIAGG